ncbi:GTP cyclohydrolase 1, partial [Cucurbita argyrosperma subsp. sororia]
MTSAVTSILKSLGEDPSRKELLGTPGHFVNWLMNFQNCNVDMKTDMKKLNGFANGRTHLEHENGNLSDKQIQSEMNFLFWSQSSSSGENDQTDSRDSFIISRSRRDSRCRGKSYLYDLKRNREVR